MKSILTTLAIIMATTLSFGQITEGKVEYDLKFSSSNAEVAAQLSMVQGSKLVQAFSAEGTRTEMNMGMIQSTTTIKNNKEKKSISLLGGMMGYKAMINDFESTAEAKENDLIVEKTNETKTILGIVCTKHVIDLGPETGMLELYLTEEIIPATKVDNQFIPTDVTGFPLEFSLTTSDLTITSTAVKIAKVLKKDEKKELFSTKIPSGYELMKKEELLESFMD